MCADDYAIAPATNRAIRELLAAERISATSVMAASEFWPDEAAGLRAAAGRASIGLHITLTDQRPLGSMPRYAPEGRFPPLGLAFRAGVLGRLPLDEVRREIERQFQSFVAHFGRPPMHIDGHHHIHQLPGIRDIVFDLAKGLGTPVWVRASGDSLAAIASRGIARTKAMIIAGPAWGVRRLADRRGFPVNTSFTGVYDIIGERRAFHDLVPDMLTRVADNGLMMCHPGIADAELAARDPMGAKREDEFRYFMSEAWPRLLEARGLELGAFRFD